MIMVLLLTILYGILKVGYYVFNIVEDVAYNVAYNGGIYTHIHIACNVNLPIKQVNLQYVVGFSFNFSSCFCVFIFFFFWFKLKSLMLLRKSNLKHLFKMILLLQCSICLYYSVIFTCFR